MDELKNLKAEVARLTAERDEWQRLWEGANRTACEFGVEIARLTALGDALAAAVEQEHGAWGHWLGQGACPLCVAARAWRAR